MKIFAGLFEGGRRHCGIENPNNFAALETIKVKEANPNVAVLDDMIGISDDQQMYMCLACQGGNFKSNRKDTIKRHLRMVHTERQDVKCPHCNNFYKNENTLKTHIRRSHR